MANIKDWLLEIETVYGESIEAIVVGKHDNASYDARPQHDENVILAREVGLNKLDQEYDNGYGGADCYPMFAWTKTRIFFITEYDGATGMSWAPRHPMAVNPQFSGNTPMFDILDKRTGATGSPSTGPETKAETKDEQKP
jgi:hypothetical protein